MYRVLIVDDHATVRQGVRQALDEQLHPDAQGEASNADEAIAMVEHDEWDVVILDVNMPGKGGMEALRAMKQHNPSLPVIMFSVFPPEQVAQRFMAAGAYGYVSKGGPAEELVQAIRGAVSARPTAPGAVCGCADAMAARDDSLTAWRL
ncbi:MAG: response regulator transcription factor [Armatimonadetes bacterium]|nr:response regulator transcription factor [Armatimonadota bacterium]